MMYYISCFIFEVLLKILCRLEVKGRENLPKKGPFIVASNHASFADPAVMGAACNTTRISFMAKRELFERPIFGAWCKAVGCIPVERRSGSSGALKKAIQILKRGQVLGIFPEGTRSLDGKLQKAEPGIGLLVAKAGVPVIPVYLSGTAGALPRGARVPRLHKVTAKIGKKIDLNEILQIHEKKKMYGAIGEKVMDAISRLKI
ncbi:MAG: 1-acyl-sn-glycerol-3-phosphate acyltransferase [Candidatus Omnitrophica bacterium]|nr:1-acyl-sn-glycerol-3-phosphate acyltransferase [Candidatus Omnitrophota bacterium]